MFYFPQNGVWGNKISDITATVAGPRLQEGSTRNAAALLLFFPCCCCCGPMKSSVLDFLLKAMDMIVDCLD